MTRARRVRGAALVVALGASTAALALALLRLADPSQRRLVELVALVPFGLPLAVAGTVFAMALGPPRWRAVVVTVSASLAVAHGAWVAPLFVGPVPGGDPGCALTVLSQNLEYGDPAELGRQAVLAGADVLVVLQTDGGRLAHLRSVTSELDAWTSSESLNVVVLTRLPVLERAVAQDGTALRLRVRSCLGAIDVVGAHPQSTGDPEGWARDHATVRSFVTARSPASTVVPVVVAGDLNATLDHAPLRRLLGDGLRDAVEIVNGGWQPTYPVSGTERRLGIPLPLIAPIDHVLVSEQLTVSRAETVAVPGADHLGVLARLHPVPP